MTFNKKSYPEDIYKDKKFDDKLISWEYIIFNGKDKRTRFKSIEYLRNILHMKLIEKDTIKVKGFSGLTHFQIEDYNDKGHSREDD